MRKNLLILISVLSISAYSQIPLTGMIAGYDFNGNANDVSGNGHNGTVFGANLTTSRIGVPNNAYSFNGAGNYILIPNAAGLTPVNLTLCAEVKVMGFYTGTCQGNEVICKGADFTAGHYSLFFTSVDYSHNCSIVDTLHESFKGDFGNNTTADSNYLYTPYIVDNIWYCVICTFDGSTIKTYVDGVLKSSFSATNPLVADNSPICIGCGYADTTSFPYWLNGIVDDIRIYNRVLTLNEIGGYCSVLAGVDEINDLSNSIHIYPNPSNGKFHISLNKKLNVQLTVSNLLGEKIYSTILNEPEKEIELQHAAAGIYFVRVADGEKIYTQKLVIE